ncbi:H/ACA ribonucleoprotein complex non-core subunit NAF1-like [Xyrauchen texanus]|uniref:H/ACA ribonucleoprotein complex non-core subunit NAF1-like n=1 Tax=Xyrauchen texanus TaxID=154827 RepID=UPI0022428B76|nr:H/ACA ribonucleoprotein complex non-core subunit NAF1-like [Xyrauchen texanus]
MESSIAESINDSKVFRKDETKSGIEKMEVHSNILPFQLKADQSSSCQLGPAGEPCSSNQSRLTGDQCTSVQFKQTVHKCTSIQLEQSGDHCNNIELEQTADQCTSIQLEQTADQCINIQPKQCTSPQYGLTGDQCISIQSERCSSPQSEQTGDHCTSVQLEQAGDRCTIVQSGTGSLALLSMQYRGNGSDGNCSESDTDSSSSTSTSSSSSSSSEPLMVNHAEDGVAKGHGKGLAPVQTQDGLLLEDLPAVENLTISLTGDTEIEPVGMISSIVERLVIVESFKNTPPLNEDSVLFSKDRNSIGKVFEVFGPVCQPYYVLRFNSHEDIDQKDLKIRDLVYFAPKIKDFTDYIFTEQLKETKGSDASWKNDQEPPPEALDFSDDEQERLAKQKLKEQKRRQQNDSNSEDESDVLKAVPPQKCARRKPRQNHNVPRVQHHNRGGGFHSNYHAHPYFPHSEYMYPPSDPHMFPFQGPMYPPYHRPPPFPMGMHPRPPGANQGYMFQPPPPPPPPPSNR